MALFPLNYQQKFSATVKVRIEALGFPEFSSAKQSCMILSRGFTWFDYVTMADTLFPASIQLLPKCTSYRTCDATAESTLAPCPPESIIASDGIDRVVKLSRSSERSNFITVNRIRHFTWQQKVSP